MKRTLQNAEKEVAKTHKLRDEVEELREVAVKVSDVIIEGY